MKQLLEQSSIDTVASSSQGVCFDGTYYYVTDSDKIYKYDTSGNKVAERDCTSDGVVHHLGQPFVLSGVLYIVAGNYPTSDKGYVKEYNPSDLSYDTETQLYSDRGVGCLTHDGSNFWTSSSGQIDKWESGWNNPTTYTPDFSLSDLDSSHSWNGITFKDGYLYANPHDGVYPPMLQKFEVDNTNEELHLVEHLIKPKWCTQGLDVDGYNFIFVRRGQSEVSDGVVIAKLEPHDHRENILRYNQDNIPRSTGSTGYTENTNLKTKIYARKGDVIEVYLQGLFRVSNNSLRAYVQVSGSSDKDADILYPARTIRTKKTGSEGYSGTQIRHFRAKENGVITFAMFWKQNASGQTAYVEDLSISAKIIGIGTN